MENKLILISPYGMVDDSIDVDKLLIRTWHTLPADLGEGTGVTQGSSHNVGRRADMSGRGFGFEEDETYGLKYVILGMKCSDTWVTGVDGQNSLDNARGLVFYRGRVMGNMFEIVGVLGEFE